MRSFCVSSVVMFGARRPIPGNRMIGRPKQQNATKQILAIVAGLLLVPFAFTQDQSAGPARELSIVTPGSGSSAPPSKTWPSFEVFTGFSEINIDNKQVLTSVPRKWASGWETSVGYNFSRHWAMEADASGYYT